MDQVAVVNEQIEGGKQLIELLAADGLDVRVAFWAKPSEEDKWYLYLATPAVQATGPVQVYRSITGILRRLPDSWIDPFDVRVIGTDDTLGRDALALIRPKEAEGPFGVRPAKPYPGMTRFYGQVLGGVSIDGAYIYPPFQPIASS